MKGKIFSFPGTTSNEDAIIIVYILLSHLHIMLKSFLRPPFFARSHFISVGLFLFDAKFINFWRVRVGVPSKD